MEDMDTRLNGAWWALRIGLGVGPIAAGLDKYFNLLANWEAYLSPLITKMLPVSATTFMHIVGVVEIAAGIIVLTRWTKLGGYIVGAWLVAIAINLLTTGMYFDVAVRDLEIAVGAFALSQLSAVRERSAARETVKNQADSRLIATP